MPRLCIIRVSLQTRLRRHLFTPVKFAPRECEIAKIRVVKGNCSKDLAREKERNEHARSGLSVRQELTRNRYADVRDVSRVSGTLKHIAVATIRLSDVTTCVPVYPSYANAMQFMCTMQSLAGSGSAGCGKK